MERPAAFADISDQHGVCPKNTFVSKRMRIQLRHVGWMNIVLLVPAILFNMYSYDYYTGDNDGLAACLMYNDVRVIVRVILWATSAILFLPTTGLKPFKLYRVRYESLTSRLCQRLHALSTPPTKPPTKPPTARPYVVRTNFLRLCEVTALCQIALLAFTMVYIPLGMFEGSWTWNCYAALPRGLVYILHASSFILSIWAYLVTWDFLVMFHQLRTHLLFQHCVFGDAQRARDGPFGRSPKEVLRHCMWMAIRDQNLDALKLAVARAKELDPTFAKTWFCGAKIRCIKYFARSQHNPLHFAIKTRQAAAVTFLLESGFDPNALEKVQVAEFGLRNIYQDVFYFFSHSHREPPSLYGPRGWFKHTLLSPLHVAVIRSDHQLVTDLLVAGADPNVSAQSSSAMYATPPLFWATNVDVTRTLLEHGANQLFVPKYGFYMTAYEDAVIQGRHAIVRLLESWGGDIALTPLHDAAAQGEAERMDPFLSPVSVNTLGEQSNGLFRRTPLHWAAIRGQVETARVLLENGASVNAFDTWGRTPLMWACYLNHAPLVEELLVNWHADPSVVDYLGQSIPCLCASRDGSFLEYSCIGDSGDRN
ncbi:hypothetical protein SDRG_13633 [Saprolegnia diclina VS20]|uniref:Palmitoyltransferase n=1 Tax=Saprolegnia diclina (strain VS20) TaxID=1156394 RepID=T0Q561_SAPDV|nr:hypothetical protein SDRG_13633 [Saprolegnia diclina VS20]EQC28555.1 hypothetical protein SDRG_13633 [Saprolegnia diclina VS20]|eukprot:XP_008617952.1 hypothetical protein SDRG_13633 [Saprolegnia diclina VS20]